MRLDTAAALAPMESVWRALLAAHVSDNAGRCAECRWQTRSADRWPCNVYLVAAAARRLATTPNGPTPHRRDWQIRGERGRPQA